MFTVQCVGQQRGGKFQQQWLKPWWEQHSVAAISSRFVFVEDATASQMVLLFCEIYIPNLIIDPC